MSVGRRTVGGAIAAIAGGLIWAFNAFGVAVDVVSIPADAGTLRGAATAALRKFAEIPEWGIYLFLGAVFLIGFAMLVGWHPEKGWRWPWREKAHSASEPDAAFAKPAPSGHADSTTEEEAPARHPTVRELYETELDPTGGTVLTYYCGGDMQFADGTTLEYFHRLFCDFSAHAKYIAYYVPTSKHPEAAILGVVNAVEDHVDADLHAVINQATSEVGPIDEKSLTFTKKVYVYHDDDLNPSQLGRIYDAFVRAGLQPDFRGPRYALRQKPLQHPKTGGKAAFTFEKPFVTQRTRSRHPDEEPPPPSRSDTGPEKQP